MIEPKNIVIDDIEYVIHKIPAYDGREIFSQYFSSAIPKTGSYVLNKAMSLKLMKFVKTAENGIFLETEELVNNHVKYGFESLLKLEYAVLEYNCSFLARGRISSFLEDIAQKVPLWISKMLMDSLGRLSPLDKQPSTN